MTAFTKLRASSLNLRSSVPKLPGGKIRQKEISHRCNLKRKMIQETPESITMLNTEKNQLHLDMGDKIYTLKDHSSVIPLSVCSPTVSNCLDSLGILTNKNDYMCGRGYNCETNTGGQKQLEINLPSFTRYSNKKQVDRFEGEGTRKTRIISEIAAPNNWMRETIDIRGMELTNTFNSKLAALICSENFDSEDYLKLLELDNIDDERRFRIAMEMPLSPTLPEICSPRFPLYLDAESPCVVDEFLKRTESKRDGSVSFQTFDVIDLEINSNMVELKTSNTRELSDNERTYSSGGPKCSGVFTTPSDFNWNGILHDIEHMGVVEEYDAGVSNDLMNKAELGSSIVELQGSSWQSLSHVKCLFDPSNASPDVVAGKLNEYSRSRGASHCPSKSIVGSKLLHEVECAQCCNVESYNLARNTSPITKGPEKSLVAVEVPNSGLIKQQIEGNGEEHDDIINSQWIRHGLLYSGTSSLSNSTNNLSSTGRSAKKCRQPVLESSTTTRCAKQMPVLAIRKFEDRRGGNVELNRISKYCFVFSKIKDEGSIARIIHARDALIYQDFMVQPECLIAEVLRVLTSKLNLVPEEKLSVFFSWLLHDIFATTLANSRSITNGDILRCSKSFGVKISTVISDREASRLFHEICRLDILLDLFEDFLISREILIFNDMKSERFYPYVSSNKFYCLKGGNMCFAYTIGTVDQLVAVSIVLSRVCAATNQIGSLLEAAYRFLRMCKTEASWVLQALHVFALVIGKKFFTLNNYNFLVDTIRSVVLLLESGDGSLSQRLHSSCAKGPCYPHRVPSGNRRAEESTDCKYDDVNADCDASCTLFKYTKHAADRSDCIYESSFCHYIDMVSLMELLGSYMSWEWAYNNVIPHLIETLESCKYEEFAAALFVLIGQLARFGIDGGGYQQNGVREIRCRLSMLLERKMSFATQLAAVASLLSLLPLHFGEIVNVCIEHPMLASQSSSALFADELQSMKKWFFHLSRELQSLSLSFFACT